MKVKKAVSGGGPVVRARLSRRPDIVLGRRVLAQVKSDLWKMAEEASHDKGNQELVQLKRTKSGSSHLFLTTSMARKIAGTSIRRNKSKSKRGRHPPKSPKAQSPHFNIVSH